MLLSVQSLYKVKIVARFIFHQLMDLLIFAKVKHLRILDDLQYIFILSFRPSPEDEKSEGLLSKYSLPAIDKFRFSEHLMHPPSKENYRLWMHQMLYVEEFAQIDKISK